MYIPNSVIYFNEKPFLELSFNNEENDKEVSEFKKWFLALEDHIFKLVKRRTSLGITKANMISAIKNGYNNISTKLLVPINLNISKCILTDEDKRNKFLFNWEIPVPTYGISIIWIKNIWVKKGKWGINLFMYASRVMNSHILDPIQFMDYSGNNKSIKTSDVLNKFNKDEKIDVIVGNMPEFAMFYKMLKVGIPKEAIKQKMTLQGIEPRVIDYPENTPYFKVLHYISNPHLQFTTGNLGSNDSSIPPPPPPPPPFLPMFGSGMGGMGGSGDTQDNKNRLNLLNDISNGNFKLKKATATIAVVDVKDKILSKLNTTGLKVPSLMDIQGALSKLKKINLDSTSDV